MVLFQPNNLPSEAMMKLVLLYTSTTSSSVQLNSISASAKSKRMDKMEKMEKTDIFYGQTVVVLVQKASYSQAEVKGLSLLHMQP